MIQPRHVTVLSLILGLSLLASPAAHASLTCERLFSPENEIMKTSAGENLANEKIALEKQLALPDSLRTDKDPRFFARFRDAASNPVTAQLTASIEAKRVQLIVLRDQADLYKKLGEVADKADAIDCSQADLKQKIQEWVVHKLIEIKTDLDAPLASRAQLITVAGKIGQLRNEVESFSVSGTGPAAQAENLQRAIAFELRAFDANMQVVVEKVLERGIRTDALQTLLAITKRPTTAEFGPAPSVVAILMRFKEIEKATRRIPTGILGVVSKHLLGKTPNPLDDSYVAYLTQMSYDHGISATQTSKLFNEINRLGSRGREKTSIYDLEVTALAGLSLEMKVAPKTLVARYFEIEKLAKEYKGIGAFKGVNDSALVVLTKLSFSQPSSTAASTVEALFSMFDARRTVATEVSSNDLTLAMLTSIAVRKNLAPAEVSKQYRDFVQLADKSFNSKIRDEEIARFIDIGFAFEISASETVALVKQIRTITPSGLLLKSITSIMTSSLAVARTSGARLPTDDQIATVTRSILGSHQDITAILNDTLARETRISREAPHRTGAKIPGAGGRRSTPSDSNSGDSSSSNPLFFWSFSFSEGFKPSLNLGNGLGIDLTDGSLEIRSGGIVFDTDGDGISFRPTD